MDYKVKLLVENVALELISSYDSLYDYEKGARQQFLLNELRIKAVDFLEDATSEEVEYVLSYIKDNGPLRLYLDLQNTISEWKSCRNIKKSSSIIKWINLFVRKVRKKNEKICIDNTIPVGRDSSSNQS